MLILACFVLAVLTALLAGGRLSRLVDVRFRWAPSLLVALVLQVALFSLRDGDAAALGLLHVSSYFFAAGFLVANRRIPGLWLVGLGGLSNLIAISANGGVMPASSAAWEAANLATGVTAFSNSGMTEGARLAFLGDVFAVPSPLPFANVFSVGDVLLVIGGLIAIHRLTGSRLIPSGTGQFVELRRYPSFVRLWSAQGISNIGDWAYSLAVATSITDRGDAAHVLAMILIAQVGPAAIAGLLGGPLIDRVNRVRLMVATDVVRAAAVGSLVLTGAESLPHLYAVAAVLGVSGALFQPAMHASLPNLLPRNRLVAANALVSGTYHMAIMVGPVLGGVLVSSIGIGPAFAVNAATFLLSAILIVGIKLRSESAEIALQRPVRALVDGLRYSVSTPLVRGILITISIVVFAAALRSPLEPVFIINVLGGETTALGLVGGAWGLGMLLGSLAAPAAARRWAREHLLWVSIAVVGVAVLLASRAAVLSPVLAFWLFAGGGNAVGTIAYESLLQERTPDAFRGRVMAATEAVTQAAYLAGAAAAAAVAGGLGIRGAYIVSGSLFLVGAVVSRIVLPPSRRRSARVAETRFRVDSDSSRHHDGPPLDGPLDDLPELRGTATALVVADDLDAARTLCNTLSRAGYDVDRAGNVGDLEFALRHLPAPALLVVDEAMAGGQGPAVIRSVRGTRGWENTRAVLVGDATRDADALEALLLAP